MDTVNSLPRFLQPDSPKNHELNSSQVNLNLIFVLPSVLAYCRLEVKRQWNLLLSQMNFSLDQNVIRNKLQRDLFYVSPNLTVEILISGLIDYLVALRIVN